MGDIAQANASVLLYASETTYGVAPGTTYNTARIISANLAQRTGFTQSAQLNTSRQPTDTIRNQVSAEGSIGVEFSAIAHESFIESLFGSSMANIVSGTSTASISTASGVVLTTSASLFTSTETGDWIRISGMAAGNNGDFYVITKDSNTQLTIAHSTASGATSETGTTGVGLNMNRLAVGSTLTSLALEQKVPTGIGASTEDLYHLAAGCVMTSMRLDIAPGEIIRGNFDWVGKNVVQATTSDASAVNAIATTQIANAIDNVVFLREGSMDPKETWKVASFALNVTSPAEPRYAISDEPGATPGAISLALRPFGATATLRVYVEHADDETNGVKDIIDAYLSGSERNGLAVILRDDPSGSGVKYDTVFHFNKYKITRADIPIGGNDQDLFLEMEITAVQDTSAGPAGSPWSFMVHRNEELV